MHVCYDLDISAPEANVLENIWRQSIRRCIAQQKDGVLEMMNASPRTYLPEELWRYIFSIHDTSPRMVSNLQHIGYSVYGKLYRVEICEQRPSHPHPRNAR